MSTTPNPSAKDLYDALHGEAAKRGMDLNIKYRGVVPYFNQLKQGGATLSNAMLANLARALAKDISHLGTREKLGDLANQLNVADTYHNLKRFAKKPPHKYTEVDKDITDEDVKKGIRRKVDRETDAPKQVPIHHPETGKPMGLKTPTGRVIPLFLKPQDVAPLEQAISGTSNKPMNPAFTGFFQKKELRADGSPHDPLVHLEMFNERTQKYILRTILHRMKKEGIWTKGAHIVEYVEGSSTEEDFGKTIRVPLPRTRRADKIPAERPGETPKDTQRRVARVAQMQEDANKGQPTNFSPTLADERTIAQGPKNRSPSGRIKGGVAMISGRNKTRTPSDFQYDLPPGVDQILTDKGKYRFSYPGSNTPAQISEVVDYFQDEYVKNPNTTTSTNLIKMKRAQQAHQFEKTDPSGAATSLDSTPVKPMVRPTYSSNDPEEYQVSAAKDNFTQLREEQSSSDRQHSDTVKRIRETEENKDPKQKGKGRKVVGLEGSKQHKFLKRIYNQYLILLQQVKKEGGGVPDTSHLDERMANFSRSGREVEHEDVSTTSKNGEPEVYKRPVLKSHRGPTVVLVSSKTKDVVPSKTRTYHVPSATALINALQRQIVLMERKRGVGEATLTQRGLSLSRHDTAKKPYPRAATKNLITSPFAKKKEEMGVIEGSAKSRGRKLSNKIEEKLQRLVTTTEGDDDKLMGRLNLLADWFHKAHDIPISQFMRRAQHFHPRIEHLINSAIVASAPERADPDQDQKTIIRHRKYRSDPDARFVPSARFQPTPRPTLVPLPRLNAP